MTMLIAIGDSVLEPARHLPSVFDFADPRESTAAVVPVEPDAAGTCNAKPPVATCGFKPPRRRVEMGSDTVSIQDIFGSVYEDDPPGPAHPGGRHEGRLRGRYYI